MAVDKCCAASRKALQAESAASEIQHVKNTFVENCVKSKQMHAQKMVCGNEFATKPKKRSSKSSVTTRGFWVSFTNKLLMMTF